MVHYTGTTLAKKLGITTATRLLPINVPAHVLAEVLPLPDGAIIVADTVQHSDCVLLFVQRVADLQAQFPIYAGRLAASGVLWVAWPKKSGRLATDLSFEIVQHLGLTTGLVDNKICSISSTWSGLRFVVRVKDRPAVRVR